MKTIEEAAKEYGDIVSPYSTWTAKNAETSFKAGAEFMQKEYEEKLRWIPVEEKLPENIEKVLIKYCVGERIIIGCGSCVLDSKLGIYWQSGRATQLKVTHWSKIL